MISARQQAARAGARQGVADSSEPAELIELAERKGTQYALDTWLGETLDAVAMAAECAHVPARWRRVWERAYVRACCSSDRRHQAEGLL